jgi:hypothetical protein
MSLSVGSLVSCFDLLYVIQFAENEHPIEENNKRKNLEIFNYRMSTIEYSNKIKKPSKHDTNIELKRYK